MREHPHSQLCPHISPVASTLDLSVFDVKDGNILSATVASSNSCQMKRTRDDMDWCRRFDGS